MDCYYYIHVIPHLVSCINKASRPLRVLVFIADSTVSKLRVWRELGSTHMFRWVQSPTCLPCDFWWHAYLTLPRGFSLFLIRVLFDRGHHIYKWSCMVLCGGRKLPVWLDIGEDDTNDPKAVAVWMCGVVVGHLLRACSLASSMTDSWWQLNVRNMLATCSSTVYSLIMSVNFAFQFLRTKVKLAICNH